MKNLLITKFRGKYSGNNDESDRQIKSEVEKFLEAEQMTE